VSLGDSGDGPLHEVSPDVWDRTIAVNLTGTYRVCHAALPGMLELGRGVIINFASLAALVGIGLHAYSASKGGVAALSRSIAVTYGAQGVRCNAIAPGPIETPMTADMLSDPERRRARLATIPRSRPGTTAEVAALVRFLASDEADFITGTVLSIDGGAAAM
jgi:NAD(P)-dependent dehydrogenase (short-subunit alcohol dehydrogenase family)